MNQVISEFPRPPSRPDGGMGTNGRLQIFFALGAVRVIQERNSGGCLAGISVLWLERAPSPSGQPPATHAQPHAGQTTRKAGLGWHPRITASSLSRIPAIPLTPPRPHSCYSTAEPRRDYLCLSASLFQQSYRLCDTSPNSEHSGRERERALNPRCFHLSIGPSHHLPAIESSLSPRRSHIAFASHFLIFSGLGHLFSLRGLHH